MLAFYGGFSGIILSMKTVVSSDQKTTIPKGLSLEKLIEELTRDFRVRSSFYPNA